MNVSQTDFRTALLTPDAPRPTGLSDGTGAPAGRRFDVYRNNVAVSLTEALETAFPVIAKLVGAQNFKLLAAAFLRQHPPATPMMMFYGAEMPGFVARFEPTRTIGYLPDIARLELAIRESYHAADAEAMDPAHLQALTPDALMAARFSLAPSVRLIRSDWPIHAIWRFNVGGGPKPAMAAEDVVVLRPDFDPEPVLLPPGGGALLTALMEGETMGAALDAVDEDFDLPATLAILIGGKALTGIGDER